MKVPFLEEELYSYELDYAFEKKPSTPSTTIDLTNQNRTTSSSPLPYVKVQLELKNLPKEIERCRIVNNQGGVSYNKKIKSLPVKIEIDMGFAEDIKDQVGPYRFTVNLIDANKEVLRVVVFEFDSDGKMFVNSSLRGKI